MQKTTRPTLLSKKELAAFLGVSLVTIERRAKAYPHYRVGGQLRYDLDEVLSFIREDPSKRRTEPR